MEIYKKLYAYLVGEIDDTIQIICHNLLTGQLGREELIAIGEKLRDALLTAEERYLDATEDEDES